MKYQRRKTARRKSGKRKQRRSTRRQRKQRRQQRGGNLITGLFSSIGQAITNVTHGISTPSFPIAGAPAVTPADQPQWQTHTPSTGPDISQRVTPPEPTPAVTGNPSGSTRTA